MKPIKILMSCALMVVGSIFAGCVKPYDKPAFVEIKPNETAFLVPLTKEKQNQSQVLTEEFLKDKKVSAARIQIPHEWIQTGRMGNDGKYFDTMRVIKVDLSPEVREWSGDSAVRAETKESTSFTAGMTFSGAIKESNAAKFVGSYRGESLDNILDTKVRKFAAGCLTEEASKYTIDELLVRKGEIMTSVRKKVSAYCENTGITMDALNFVGTFHWENQSIQQAFDEKVKSRQQAEVQQSLAQATVKAARAQKEAAEIMANSNSKYAEYLNTKKKLEIQEKWVEQWDGHLPAVQSGNAPMYMSIPASIFATSNSEKG
jgi:DNA-directed RNA polymerase subunit L